MSGDRFSVGEFNDYLDDSEGHRLAQFLQKKTGKEPSARPVFNYEPERFSLDVRVKRVSTPRNIRGRQGESADELISSPLKWREEDSNAGSPPNENKNQNDKILVAEHEPHVDPTSLRRIVPPSIKRVNKEENEKKPDAGSEPEAPAQHRGECRTGDQLRCYSLRRVLLMDESRMLLKDFESVQSTPDFAPLVCSTPMSRQQLKSPVAAESHRADPADGDTADSDGVTFRNAACNSLVSSELPHIRGKDKDLCEKLANLMEATIQKPHEKENNNTNVRTDVFDRLNSSSRQHLGELTCASRICQSSLQQMDANIEIPDRCLNAVSLQQRVNTEVQGTQELVQEVQRLLKSLDSTKVKVPKVVVVVEQTFSGVPPTQLSQQVLTHDTGEEHRKEDDTANLPNQEALQQEGEKQTPSLSPCSEKPASPQLHSETSQVKTIAENATMDKKSIMARIERQNSLLAKIMTEDDDDDADESHLTIASSGRKSGPLDLATVRPASGTPLLPSRRLRRLAGSHHRRGSLDCSHLASTETNAGSPPAHPYNLQRPQTTNQKEAAGKRPLNKAPSMPINGEKFADELKAHLARLTNYEILDLRKRNSLGDIFRISERPHSLVAKKQAMGRQLQLEEQIQKEILRRNLEDNGDELANIQEEQQVQPQGDEMAIVHENIVTELPLVPDKLRDSPVLPCTNLEVDIVMSPRNDELLLQTSAGAGHWSSLVDERSCDRILFVQPSSNLSKPIRSSRRKKYKKKIPEIVQKYRDVRNKIVKHRPFNQTRRSLYSKGDSDPEPKEDEYLSLTPPPHTPSPIVSPHVPSPPPPISGNFNVKLCQEILPPPVPFMDADTGSTTANIESKDATFKKPQLPAPKKLRKRKQKETTKTSVQMDASEVPLLRRSKREHVPVDNTFLQSMFRRLVQHQEQIKNRSRCVFVSHVESTPPVASSTAISHLGTASHSRRQGKKPRNVQSSTESDLYLSSDTDASCQSTASLKNRRVPTSVRHQRRELTAIFEPLVELEAEDIVDVRATSPTVKKTSERSEKHVPVVREKVAGIAKVDNGCNRLEQSHTQIPPAPVNELVQLKHAALLSRDASPMALSSCTGTTRRTKNVCVRLQRLKIPLSSTPLSATTNNADCHKPKAVNSCPSLSSSSNSQSVAINKAQDRVPLAETNPVTETAPNLTPDLLSWLKGVCQTQMPSGHEQTFIDMHFSAAGNLVFSVLEGIDFAFYDTDDKGSIGYLRFRPRQKKPKKKAKKYHLHFIVLAGEFEIGTDREHGTFTMGDMVAINIGRRYTIENIRDDVGLLMVIKK